MTQTIEREEPDDGYFWEEFYRLTFGALYFHWENVVPTKHIWSTPHPAYQTAYKKAFTKKEQEIIAEQHKIITKLESSKKLAYGESLSPKLLKLMWKAGKFFACCPDPYR